ncbi:hypothetical protein Q8A73_011438 [Channa argus]|nr:hypothetical protein Q8A73_011438 [Channa argus]
MMKEAQCQRDGRRPINRENKSARGLSLEERRTAQGTEARRGLQTYFIHVRMVFKQDCSHHRSEIGCHTQPATSCYCGPVVAASSHDGTMMGASHSSSAPHLPIKGHTKHKDRGRVGWRRGGGGDMSVACRRSSSGCVTASPRGNRPSNRKRQRLGASFTENPLESSAKHCSTNGSVCGSIRPPHQHDALHHSRVIANTERLDFSARRVTWYFQLGVRSKEEKERGGGEQWISERDEKRKRKMKEELRRKGRSKNDRRLKLCRRKKTEDMEPRDADAIQLIRSENEERNDENVTSVWCRYRRAPQHPSHINIKRTNWG